MRNTAILFASLLALTLSACASQGDGDTEQPYDGDAITFSAVEATIEKVEIMNLEGDLVDTFHKGDHDLYLDPGTYKVRFEDEFGNGAFTSYGRRALVLSVTNAELIPDMKNREYLLVVHDDGYTPPCNGVSDDRACVGWEANEAVYGDKLSHNSHRAEYISTNPYYKGKEEAFYALREREGLTQSCRERYGMEAPASVGPCYVDYGYMDTCTVYTEQDENGDGICSMGGCHGAKGYVFSHLVGYHAGIFTLEYLSTGNGSMRWYPGVQEYLEVGNFLYTNSPGGGYVEVHYDVIVRVTDEYVVLHSSDRVGGGYGHELIGSYTIPLSEFDTDVHLGSGVDFYCPYGDDCIGSW